MAKDDWMKQTKGGKRTSAYSAPKKKVKKKTALQKFKAEAAEFKRKRIDRYAK